MRLTAAELERRSGPGRRYPLSFTGEVLAWVWWVDSTSLAGRGFFPRRFALNAALRLQVREQRGHVGRAQSQVGHASAVVLLEESSGDRVPCVQHLIRSQDITRKPGAFPAVRHPQQVRPDFVALPDRVAGGALASEDVLSLLQLERARLRVALPRIRVSPAHKIPDARDEEPRVVQSGVPHPLPGSVAKHERGDVAVSRTRVEQTRQSQLFGDELYVFLLAGEEQPAGPDAELLRIGLQHLGRVALGVDR